MISRKAFMGGSQDLTPGANFSFLNAGRMIKVAASAGSLKGNLPDATQLRKGAPHFFIWNGGSNAFDIADNGGNVLSNLAAGQVALVSLLSNSTANGSWVIFTRVKAAITVATPLPAIVGVQAVDPVIGDTAVPSPAIVGVVVPQATTA